jgi:hypothetical protein
MKVKDIKKIFGVVDVLYWVIGIAILIATV